MLDGPSQTV